MSALGSSLRSRLGALFSRSSPPPPATPNGDEHAALLRAVLESEQAQRVAERRVLEATNDARALHSVLDERDRQLAAAQAMTRTTWVRHHAFDRLHEPVFRGTGACVANGTDDHDLVRRIIAAYARSSGSSFYGDVSMWTSIHEHVRDVHDALVAEDVVTTAELLRDPTTNRLMYGFERFFLGSPTLEDRQAFADETKDVLVRLAEALALIPVEHPETMHGDLWRPNIGRPTAEVAALVEGKLALRLGIDPVHGGVTGLDLGGRLLTVRMIGAAYLAYRSRALLPGDRGRVLEIGAGLGYAALYARQIGITDYTIVDLPLTSVAQAYFLGRMLGPDALVLEGEADAPGSAQAIDAIKIRTPALLADAQDGYDLIVNVNSLTEVGHHLAIEYARYITALAPTFLSINHEADSFTVNELFAEDPSLTIDRFPYWLRNGFVEEVVRRSPRG
jgi:hypothetical protein